MLATMSTCHGVVWTSGAAVARWILATLVLKSCTIVCKIFSADSPGRKVYVSGNKNPSAVFPAAQLGRPSDAGGWLMSWRNAFLLRPVLTASCAAISVARLPSMIVTLILVRYLGVSRYFTAMAEFM